MIIYRIFDEEYECIAGEQQLSEFAMEQVFNSPDDFEKDELESCFEEYDSIYELAQKVLSKELTELTVEQAMTILHVRCFEVEKLNVY